MSKVFSVTLMLVMAISILTAISPAVAEVPKPSVPKFTLKYVVSGFDVATTYKTDPYNGQKVVDQPGYHVNNSSIVITINNQPFDENYNGLNYYLFYNVRHKGYFSQIWTTDYSYGNFTTENINPKNWYTHSTLEQKKNSEYTTVYYLATGYPADAKIDFQVEAVLNYEGKIRVYSDGLDFTGFMIDGYVSDQESGWSTTQTITNDEGTGTTNPTPFSTLTPIPTATFAPTLNPTSTPDQSSTQTGFLFGLDWEETVIVGLLVAVACLAVGMVVLWRRVAVKS
jgi:hypothetical protein